MIKLYKIKEKFNESLDLKGYKEQVKYLQKKVKELEEERKPLIDLKNKYQFINNLPKEYQRIFWNIMIKAECNHFVSEPERLTKQDCKIIMRFLYKLFNNIKEIQQENKKYKEVNDKLKEWINIVQQNKDNKHLEPFISTDELDELLDISKEVE